MIFLDKKGRAKMTALTESMFVIFDQPEFSFKKIKENHSPEEVADLKEKFKAVWQVWKKVNQTVASQLPTGEFAKVHVESWTNGWNLRDHYWASYRLASLADYNSCIGVMLDKKQLQVYLMFQHYKSEQRQGTPDEYNQLLDKIPEWANDIDTTRWYLWDKDEMEFSDHMSLTNTSIVGMLSSNLILMHERPVFCLANLHFVEKTKLIIWRNTSVQLLGNLPHYMKN